MNVAIIGTLKNKHPYNNVLSTDEVMSLQTPAKADSARDGLCQLHDEVSMNFPCWYQFDKQEDILPGLLINRGLRIDCEKKTLFTVKGIHCHFLNLVFKGNRGLVPLYGTKYNGLHWTVQVYNHMRTYEVYQPV